MGNSLMPKADEPISESHKSENGTGPGRKLGAFSFGYMPCVREVSRLDGADLWHSSNAVVALRHACSGLRWQLVPLDPAQDFNIDDWREGIVGKISIWHPGAEDWAPLDSVNDAGNKGDYHFYVPDVSTRREWDIGTPETPDPLCQYLEDCEGPMAIKFTHIAPAAKTMGFVSKYDLVQFYHVDDSAQWSSMMAGGASSDPYLAADFNYDGVQDSTDVALFTDAWSNLRRSADFNGDGVVNATDLAQFLAASARTSSGGGSSEW